MTARTSRTNKIKISRTKAKCKTKRARNSFTTFDPLSARPLRRADIFDQKELLFDFLLQSGKNMI
jgi:hypothetical protein